MKPTNEQELAEAIATAKGPLDIRGGGTRLLGHKVAGEVLETSGLTGISLYEPGALTLVAKAGTSVSEVNAALASENQRLPFEPWDYRKLQGSSGEPTVGGMAATNASGPRRIQAGACRDSMIGVRLVDGQGNVLKNGGRVMKNVTGYDLVKLMSGSHGTLGVISEVAFKVLPAPEASASIVIDGLSDVEAVRAMSDAFSSPNDVNAAAHIPASGQTALRVEGLAGSVDYRSKQLVKMLGGKVAEFNWDSVRDVHEFAGKSGDVWRFSVRPSDGPVLAEALRQKGATELFYDLGGGLVWALAVEGLNLRDALGDIKGHATLVRASDETKTNIPVFHSEGAGIERINQGLRSKFDPRAILNTGRMG